MRHNRSSIFGFQALAIIVLSAPLSGCFSKNTPTGSLQLSSDRNVQKQAVIVSQQNPTGIDKQVTGSINSSFFETSAIPFANLTTQNNWDRVRNTAFDDLRPSCTVGACGRRFRELSSTIARVESQPFYVKIQAVNSAVNAAIKYTPDSQIYVKQDHWATANQTIETGLGDCEDIAILKHAMLLKAGIPASSMSLVVVKDTSRNLYHAVLAMSTNGGHLILDNVSNNIYRDTSVDHYQPLYSFSDDRSWIHGVDENSSNTILAQTAHSLGSVAPGESVFVEPTKRNIDLYRTEDISPVEVHKEPG